MVFAISNVRFARMRELSHAYKNRFYRFARLFACEKRRRLRAAEKKRPYPIREVPCVLQLTISALADIIGKVWKVYGFLLFYKKFIITCCHNSAMYVIIYIIKLKDTVWKVVRWVEKCHCDISGNPVRFRNDRHYCIWSRPSTHAKSIFACVFAACAAS